MSVESILTEQGRVLAESRRARGSIYGNLVQNLSRVPGQVIDARRAEQDRIAAQRVQTQQGDLRDQQLESGRRELAAGADAAASTSLIGKVTAAALTPEGDLDLPKAIALANQAGRPQDIVKIQALAQRINADNAEARSRQARAQKEVQETDLWHQQKVGEGARTLLESQADEADVLTQLSAWSAAKFLPQDQAEQMARMAQSPGGRAALLTRLAKSAPADKLMNVPEGGTVVSERTGAVVVKGTPKPDTKGPNSQESDFLLDGKPVKGDYLPSPTGGKYIYNGQDVTGRAQKIPPASAQSSIGAPSGPGNWDLEGEAFLDTIPKSWRATVKKIARYDEDVTKVTSMRGGERAMVMKWVNQVNPAYDQSQFSNRAPTRKAFTIGTQGKQINNINTAIGHIDQLTTVADQLQNGGFVPANKAWNSIRTAFGSDKVTNFDTLKDALAGEVAGVLSQSGATVSGIADAQAKIKAANSPTQLAGYVKTLIPVMGSKLASLDYQFHQAMGAEDTFSALSPESKRILTKHGFDPEHPTLGSGNATGTAPPAPAGWKYVPKAGGGWTAVEDK